ncbi:hypothetical protein INR49_012458 [Caranx melampygus]|nr:hypothetical protein INR49_012458 [Caranx melampygus]
MCCPSTGEVFSVVVMAVAVEGRRHHHGVGEGCGSGAGAARRGQQGAEVEQRTQRKEGGAG